MICDSRDGDPPTRSLSSVSLSSEHCRVQSDIVFLLREEKIIQRSDKLLKELGCNL